MPYSIISDGIGTINQFTRRKRIKLSHSGILSAYQIKLTIAYEVAMQVNFNDIRFVNEAGAHYPCWVESKTDGLTADVWVKCDLTDGDTYIWMYYGNVGAASDWDGEATFPFFDDFPGSSLDTSKWNYSGTIVVGSSEVSLNQDDEIQAKTMFGLGYAVVAKSKADEQDVGFTSWRATIGSSTNSQTLANTDYHYSDDFDRYNCNSSKAGSNQNNYIDSWDDFRNTYKNYEIQRISGSSTVFNQESNTFNETETTYIPTVNMGACLRVWDSSQASTLISDWIFIRKCVSSPPTYTFGSEEHQRRIPQFM